MHGFSRLQNMFAIKQNRDSAELILPVEKQIKTWRKAGRKMCWRIKEEEYKKITNMPLLSEDDIQQGFIGAALFYGFGGDGNGHADSVLSGKLAWEYALKRRRRRIWQCEYVDFEKPRDIRIRPDAPARPKGFYFAKIQPGKRFQNLTVSQLRKNLRAFTGFGPEGFQLLSITHPHFAVLMTERKIPFMALADYDVAPHGFNDFYDAPQLFCSNRILGLGIGNVDRNYPLFGIPTLRFDNESIGGPQTSEEV
jgi:hypothetical protein